MVLNNTRVLFQIGEGYAAIQRGGGRPVVGDGDSLMTFSAGSETTLSNKYNIQICNGFWTIQVHLILKTGHGIYFF